MTADHDFERLIVDHYRAEAPATAPGWVLERALASIEATPQRRTIFGRPARLSVMPWNVARLGVVAVAIAAVGLVGLTLMRQPAVGPVPSGSGSPSASPRPSPSPGWSRFDSTFNGMSIDYPSGWTARAATEPWGGKIAFDLPDVDVIFDPTFRGDLYLAVASEPIGSKPPRDWVTEHTDSPSLGICFSGGGGGIFPGFQGNPAWFQECREPTGRGGNIVIFATPTRGYIIYLHVADEPSLQATYDGGWFEGGVLATVALRPEEALHDVLPSALQSPSSSALPSPSAGNTRFDSTINGMSIDYPSGWQTKPATEAWTGGELTFDSPQADVIFDPALGKGLYLLVASRSFSTLSEDAWKAGVLAWTCPDQGGGEMWGWRVDGAYSWQQGPCNSGSIVATDSRGYLIRVVASSAVPGLADSYDWDWLKPVLATVDLRPEDAIDPPGAVAPVPGCAGIPAGATYSNRFGAPKLAATVPARAQNAWFGNRDAFELGGTCPFAGVNYIKISASMVDNVIDDACEPWTRSPVGFGTLAQAAEMIVAQPGHRTSEPTEVTIAGHAALRLEISTKDSTCTDGIGLWYGNEFGLDRDAIVYLVDLDGDTLGIGVWYDRSEATTAQVAEAEAIVKSVQIER